MKWAAVLLVVALVAIDGLTGLKLGLPPVGTSPDSSNQRNSSATGLEVGVSKEDGLKLTKTDSRTQHSRSSSQQNSHTRTASSDGNSQTDLERRRAEQTESNSAQQNSQSLSLGGQNGLLQSTKTSKRSGDTTTNTEEYNKEHSTSHDQNGGSTRDVDSVKESGNNHRIQNTYEEESSSGFGLGNGGITRTRSGSRSATNTEADNGFNRNHRTEEETSQQGGTVVHRQSRSDSEEEHEEFQQSRSQSSYSDHGQGAQVGQQQGLLNTGNQDRSGQYNFKSIRPIRHKPIFSHGNFEKFVNHQNGNVGRQTGNHGGHIGHLSSLSGRHVNGVWNHGRNTEQLFRGADYQRPHQIVNGARIQHQGANSAEYVNHNHGSDTLKLLTGNGYQGTDLNQDFTEVLNQGLNKAHFVNENENQGPVPYINGIVTQGNEYQGSDVNDVFSRVLTDGLNTANFVGGSENQATNSGEYISGTDAGDSGYNSGKVNENLSQVLNREIHSDQSISGIQNQGGNSGQYAKRIFAHGTGYQGYDETGSLSEIIKRGLNKPHSISASESQGIHSGNYVNGFVTPVDNMKYVSGTGYHSNSDEYLNGLRNRGRGVANYPVTASQASVAGKYITPFVQRGDNSGQYDDTEQNDDSEETNSQYISDILAQVKNLLKHSVPNGHGITPHYHSVPSNRGPVYRNPNSGISFYDRGSYMANPASAPDDDSSYGEIAPGYVIPTGNVGVNSYPNRHSSRPSYYRNRDLGTGLSYTSDTDGTGPTTIFGRSPGFNHVVPVNTIPVSNGANKLTPWTSLSQLTPNDYDGTSGDASDIIIDTGVLSKRDTKAPGTDGTVKKVGITTVINKDFIDKITHATQLDSNNSGTSRNINGAIMDQTVGLKHTENYGQDNGKIDKTTKIIGNNDRADVSGNGPTKPGKSIVIDRTTVFKKTNEDGKDNNNDNTVGNIKKGFGKVDGSNITGKDYDGTTKHDQSIVIDKTAVIIKSEKDGKNNDIKDKTMTNIEKVSRTGDKSWPIDNKDDETTTNGKSVIDTTTVFQRTDNNDTDVVSTTSAVNSNGIETSTVIDETLEKYGESDKKGNTETKVTNITLGDKNSDLNGKDYQKKDNTNKKNKKVSNIDDGLHDTDGDDDNNSYAKAVEETTVSNKGLGKHGGSDSNGNNKITVTDIYLAVKNAYKDNNIKSTTSAVNSIGIETSTVIDETLEKDGESDKKGNTETKVTNITSGDKNSDLNGKDYQKKDNTNEKNKKVSNHDDGLHDTDGDDDNNSYAKAVEGTTVSNKGLGKHDGSDSNGNNKITVTDIYLAIENAYKDNNIKSTTSAVNSIGIETSTVIDETLEKDGESDKKGNTETKVTNITSGDKNSDLNGKDYPKKDNTNEKNKKVSNHDDGLHDTDGDDDNNSYAKAVEGTTVSNKGLGKHDGSDSNGNNKITVTDIYLAIENAYKDNNIKSTTSAVNSIGIETSTVIDETLEKDGESDRKRNTETNVTNITLGDKNSDLNGKDYQKKDNTNEKNKKVSNNDDGLHDTDGDDDNNSYAKAVEETTVSNKGLGKHDGSDSNGNNKITVTDIYLAIENAYKDNNIKSTTSAVNSIGIETSTVIDETLEKDGESDKKGNTETKVTNITSGDKNSDLNGKDYQKKDNTNEKNKKVSNHDDGLHDTDGDDDNNSYAKAVEETTVTNKGLGKHDGSDSNGNNKITVTDIYLAVKNAYKDNNIKSTTSAVNSIGIETSTVIDETLEKDGESDRKRNTETNVTNITLGDKNSDLNGKDYQKKDNTNEKNKKVSNHDDGLHDTDGDDDNNSYAKAVEETTVTNKGLGKHDGSDSNGNNKITVTDIYLAVKNAYKDNNIKSTTSAVNSIGIETSTVIDEILEKDGKLDRKRNTETNVNNITFGDKNSDLNGKDYQKKDNNNEKNKKVSNNDDGLHDTDGDDDNNSYAKAVEETTVSNKGLGKHDGSDTNGNNKITVTDIYLAVKNPDKDNNIKSKFVMKFDKVLENDKKSEGDGDDVVDNVTDKSSKSKVSKNENRYGTNGCYKDDSGNGDGPGNDDWDDDDGDATNESDKKGKSGTYVGKEGSTKTDEVRGQKGQNNDYGTNPEEKENNGASKDGILTVSNNTGQDDSNNDKTGGSNSDHDSSNEECDDDDDEDYLSSKTNREVDDYTNSKFDKSIESRKNDGHIQKGFYKIGLVTGRNVQKNDHGTNSDESENNGASKNNKLTVFKKKQVSNKTGQDGSDDGKTDGCNSDNYSKNGDYDDDVYNRSGEVGKDENSGSNGGNYASENSDEGGTIRRNDSQEHIVLTKIAQAIGGNQQKSDQKIYSNKYEKSSVFNKETLSLKTDQAESADAKKVETFNQIKKEVKSENVDASSTEDYDEDDDNDDSYEDFGNEGKIDLKAVESDTSDGSSDEDTNKSSIGNKSGTNYKKKYETVTYTVRGRNIRGTDKSDGSSHQHTSRSDKGTKSGSNNENNDETGANMNRDNNSAFTYETFTTKNLSNLSKVSRKLTKKSKRNLETRNVSSSGLEVAHDSDGENTKDAINTSNENKIRIKTGIVVREKGQKDVDEDSAGNKNSGTMSALTTFKNTVSKKSKRKRNTFIKHGYQSGHNDKSSEDGNSTVYDKKPRTRHARANGNKSILIRKHTASSNNDESTDVNISDDESHTVKRTRSHSRKSSTEGKNGSNKHFKYDSTKKIDTDQTNNDYERKHRTSASVNDNAHKNKSAITHTSNKETVTTSTTTDNGLNKIQSKISKLAEITIKILQKKVKHSKTDIQDANNNFAGSNTTGDSRESTKTDGGTNQDKNGGTVNDNASKNCGGEESGGSSTNANGNGTPDSQTNDKIKSNGSVKREEQSRESASGYGSSSKKENLEKQGNKSTYTQQSDDSEHAEQQAYSMFTKVTKDSKGKTVQTGQKSASEQANQSSSDNYTEVTNSNNKKSKKESLSSEDKTKEDASSSGSKTVYSNGNTEQTENSSRNKSVKSSSTKEKSNSSNN